MKPGMLPERGLVRYYGGKWRIATAIIRMFPPHTIYVEPFGGSAAVLLQKAPSPTEVYNDLDSELVNAFRVMRESGRKLSRALLLTPYSREEYERAYEPSACALERARRYIFRSSAGIGSDSSRRKSGFRTSLTDMRHNTAASWARMSGHWPALIRRLRSVIIEHRPAIEVMRQYDSAQTLHYVDPPYLADTRRSHRESYVHEMSAPQQHEELASAVHGLRGRVVVSGYAHALYERAYRGWRRHVMPARDGGNNARKECLWLSPGIEDEPDLFTGQDT